MANSLNYFTLLSALNSSNNIQQLYSNYNPYSTANLYGSDDSTTSFQSIFGNCINTLQSSNSSLLSNLASSIEDTVSDTEASQFADMLQEASQNACDCKSAALVKDLYSAYTSNTAGYAKNRFNSLISAVVSQEAKTAAQDDTQNVSSSTVNSAETIHISTIESSIPTEDEIEAQIASSLAL